MRVLGIESSCDETAAAVVQGTQSETLALRLTILSSVVHSQVESHAPFGGIVPEIASREHVVKIVEVVERALADAQGLDSIDAIAVTRGPGLVGSLLVGLQVAKGIALARRLPFVGVNHLEGHLSAGLLSESPPAYPHVALVISGGHSNIYAVTRFGHYQQLGGTRDDAAGEAFDKVAKLLGLGYPGGVRIESAALGGNPKAIAFPRGLKTRHSFDFSFSGLKTAAASHLKQHGIPTGQALADFAASLQEAIADVLTRKAVLAAKKRLLPGIVLAGGVAANTRVRELLVERARRERLWAFVPPKALCTDNAAMIAAAGLMRFLAGERSAFDTSALSRWPLGDQRDRDELVKPWRKTE